MIILKDVNKDPKKLEDVHSIVASILEQVKIEGDQALIELTKQYDRVELSVLKVPRKAFQKAYELVSGETIKSLEFAAEQIKYFAEHQLACLQPLKRCEHIPGVTLGHRLVPIKTCGAYIPAGRYPLPSTALMSIIPAKVAGVDKIIACSPPSKEFGTIHPAVLVAMDIAGVDEAYCMGGAQAIGAFTYGTESVPKVDIIVGPGNKYVTEAKRLVSGSVGIDMLAGPSEVLIIADESVPAQFVAVDLLAKCEHDPNSIAIFVTTSRKLAEEVQKSIKEELKTLGTAELAARTWADNGKIIIVDSMDEAVKISDELAPEHLQIMTENDDEIAGQLCNFGSLFIGKTAPVAFGDYVSGTNHTLPTLSCARFTNGVWVGTFIKVSSVQKVSMEGASRLAGVCSHLAGVEGLLAHQRSAELRRGY